MEEKKKTVLIVDDSQTVRELLSAILKGRFEVVEAVDGYDALRKVNGHKPDIVITDIDMPDMNGVDLIRNLRNRDGCEEIPVIVISSLSPRLTGLEEGELNVAEWIEKPFSPRHLLFVISRLSDKSS